MSRIQQILSRAERDGTTAGLTGPMSDRREEEATPRARSWRNELVTESDAPLGEAANGFSGISVDEGNGVNGAAFAGRPVFGVKLNKLLVAALEPFSLAAEQYRSLRTRIVQLEGDAPRSVLAVTSPGRGDGKSLTALNLALSMAQEFDRRTVLVDADLRHARLHTLLGIPREPGLVDVLSGVVPLDEALVALPGHRLQVLPAGAVHTQPAELLGAAPMRRLLEGLRRYFDRVVIDAASAQSSDTGVLEPCLDGALIVVRAGRTPRSAIERALSAIPPEKLMGLVLNDSHLADGLSGT